MTLTHTVITQAARLRFPNAKDIFVIKIIDVWAVYVDCDDRYSVDVKDDKIIFLLWD